MDDCESSRVALHTDAVFEAGATSSAGDYDVSVSAGTKVSSSRAVPFELRRDGIARNARRSRVHERFQAKP